MNWMWRGRPRKLGLPDPRQLVKGVLRGGLTERSPIDAKVIDHPMVGEGILDCSASVSRSAVILCLDTSGSTMGRPNRAINAAIPAIGEALCRDPITADGTDIAIVSFGGDVRVVCDFTPAVRFRHSSPLHAEDDTPLAEGVVLAIEGTLARAACYAAMGVETRKAMIFLLTDGLPTDSPERLQRMAELVREVDVPGDRGIAVFPIGVEGADMEFLASAFVRRPRRLRGLAFENLGAWVAESSYRIHASQPGRSVPLPRPEDFGWTEL